MKQTKKKKKCTRAIIALILTILLTSCVSTQTSNNLAPHFYVPDIVDEKGNVIIALDENTGLVTMPLWYWKKIVAYFVDSQTAQDIWEMSQGIKQK